MRDLTVIIAGLSLAALLAAGGVALAEETTPDVYQIDLPRGENRAVIVYFQSGELRIEGGDGDRVHVSATPISTQEQIAKPKTLAHDSRAEGLKKLTNSATGMVARQREGGVEVLFLDSVASDVQIHMPRDARLRVISEAANEVVVIGMTDEVDIQADKADVFVHQSTGPVTVNAVEGWIRLTEVTGPIEANTDLGAIEATLSSISPDKPIWLSAAVGPIDIALPGESDATLNLRSTWGEIYSDFRMVLGPDHAGRTAAAPVPMPSLAAAPEPADNLAQDIMEDAPVEAKEEAVTRTDAAAQVEKAAPPVARKKSARSYGQARRLFDRDRAQPVTAPKAPPTRKRYTGRIGAGGVDIRLTTGAKNIYVRKLRDVVIPPSKQ